MKKGEEIVRIGITGPESCGKSSLAEALAEELDTLWVPEYAREYLGALDRPYEESDLLKIAKGQRNNEELFALMANRFLICDTEMTVMHIWSEHKYGRTDAYILDAFQQQDFNLLFLCDTDIPWEFDPLREHPELRSYFLEKYKNTLHAARKPFELISGDHQTRVNTCLQIIRKKFPEKFS